MAGHGIPPRHLFVSGRRAPQVPQTEPPSRTLSDAEFTAKLAGMNGVPPELFDDRELMELFLPIFRADYALSESHRDRPEPRLGCPVTAYGGAADGQITEAGLDAWSGRTDGRFRRKLFEGDHFYLRSQEAALIADICGELGVSAGEVRRAAG
jgi:medium-chain acyl-[acyl-carrier-protein] hydrolase